MTDTIKPDANELREPQTVEKRLFDLVSAFYCAEYRWPTTWDEIDQFIAGRGGDAQVFSDITDVKISSPRAIVMTINYTSASANSPRKVTYIAPPSCESNPNKDVVSIAGGGVKFKLPPNVTLMKGDQIRSRWKAPPYPDAAWASSDGAIVAVRFGEEGIKASEVAALGSDLAEAYKEAVPGLLWRSQELATAGASPVVISEFESDSSLGRIVNVVLSSSYDGRLFAITVTGAVAQADAVRELSAAIKDTLVIR